MSLRSAQRFSRTRVGRHARRTAKSTRSLVRSLTVGPLRLEFNQGMHQVSRQLSLFSLTAHLTHAKQEKEPARRETA